jgi:2-polyprenyl-3-methyl-5-hydroxy-6-metoxy-1,4-benzoquinol methylase
MAAANEGEARLAGSPADADWHELKRRIEQRVALEPSSIQLGGRELVWYRVANPDSLLEAATDDKATPAEEIDPFWAATWRAALGLDAFLSGWQLTGMRVLELGCGSGQAGTGAAIRGASVTMTDAVELALLVAKLNGWSWRDRIDWRQLKWGGGCLQGEPYPVIIGSDLVYDPHLFASLEASARVHLAPGGRLLLSEPHRHTGDHFAQWIVAAGWRTREHDIDLRDGRIPIRVFECWPS